jgi:hypothetical protein
VIVTVAVCAGVTEIRRAPAPFAIRPATIVAAAPIIAAAITGHQLLSLCLFLSRSVGDSGQPGCCLVIRLPCWGLGRLVACYL